MTHFPYTQSANFSPMLQVAAQAGQKVHLIDVDQGAVDRAQKRIEQSLQRVAKKKFAVSYICDG